MQLQTSTTTSTLTPEQMAANYSQMKGTPSASTPASSSWNAFDSAVKNDGQPHVRNLFGDIKETKKPVPTTEEPGFTSRVGSDVQNAGADVNAAISGTGKYADDNPITRGFEATSAAVGGVGKVASEALPKQVRDTLGQAGELAGGAIKGAGDVIAWLGDKIGSTKLAQNIVNAHPQIVDTILNSGEQIAKTGAAAGNIAGGILATEGGARIGNKIEAAAPEIVKNAVKTTNDTVLNAANKVPGAVKGAIKGANDTILNTAKKLNPLADTTNDLEKIKDTISPKPTAKEAKLALDQGRLIKGNEPTMFKEGTPDKIATSDQQLKSTMTIKKLIPDAARMDEPTLYSAIDSKIGNIAKKLQPEMEKTPIKQETVQNITDKWEALKKSEIENADANEEANVLKSQKQFETRLQKSESGNMNDLWNTAKEYDASVPENVKKANSMSSESLQNKKSLWLDRRAIIRDAIKDTKNGLGKTAQQGFSDMTDMYEAQNGILSKAKVETGVEPSKLSQAYNSKTGKAVRTIAKAGLGVEAGKKILGL